MTGKAAGLEITVPLMLIIRLSVALLHLGACPWKFGLRQTRVITSAPDCAGGPDCIESWGAAQARRLQLHFPSVPGKVLIQKQMYLSLPTVPQGRASCLWVECQYAVGTVAGGQRKFHISPRFLPLCSGPADPASPSGESPASQLALETQAPGQSQALKPSQPTPATGGRALRLSHPHLVTKVLSKPGVWANGKSIRSSQGAVCLDPQGIRV